MAASCSVAASASGSAAAAASDQRWIQSKNPALQQKTTYLYLFFYHYTTGTPELIFFQARPIVSSKAFKDDY